MLEREYIIERIKKMPEENLKEIVDFAEFLDAKRRRLVEEEEKEGEGGDPFTKVIGICEGPSDLAERHDKYVYGLTSFTLMQELVINKVFTGDAHFEKVNLGFEIFPK